MKNKKIGYYVADIDPENNSSLGVQRFAFKLLEEFYKKNLNLVIFCNEDNYYLFKKFEDKFKIIQLKKHSKNRIINRLLFDLFLINKYAKKQDLDILVFPKGFIPLYKLKNTKYYSVIHDLIPKYYIKDNRLNWKHRLKYIPATILLTRSAKKADKIFTVSEFSKEEIAKHTKEEKIKVIPEGFELEKPLNKLTKKLKILNKKQYFYIIGNKNPHKNLEKSLELFLKYNKKNKNKYHAVVTSEPVAEYKNNKNIIFLGKVSDKELATVYKKAELSLFLSDIEGFGLPLIESYSLETPVVFNNKTSLKELGENINKKGACDIENKESVFKAIDEVLKMGKKEILKNKKILEEKYNWEKCFEEIKDFLFPLMDA
ncbi:glycosyltransferase [Candidatus Pacearchaeota archaeon]|nr:glycosyltransferase [Candidatus Pacearchaeota archaeon]